MAFLQASAICSVLGSMGQKYWFISLTYWTIARRLLPAGTSDGVFTVSRKVSSSPHLPFLVLWFSSSRPRHFPCFCRSSLTVVAPKVFIFSCSVADRVLHVAKAPKAEATSLFA